MSPQKMVTPDAKRKAVPHACTVHAVSAVARRRALSPQQLFTLAPRDPQDRGGNTSVRAGGDRAGSTCTRIGADGATATPEAACWAAPRDRHRDRFRRRQGDDRDGTRRVEGRVAIGPTSAVRGKVAMKPVDFRKGAEGLAALVRETI
jgi:hypothetical protein